MSESPTFAAKYRDRKGKIKVHTMLSSQKLIFTFIVGNKVFKHAALS